MADAANPKKRKFSDIAPVKIVVGTSKSNFYVHKDLLCEKSSFFKAALNSQSRESMRNTIELAEDSVQTFEVFVEWLYSRVYDLELVMEPDEDSLDMDDDDDMEFATFAALYSFAEKYDVKDLKQGMTRALHERLKGSPQCTNVLGISKIWDVTGKESGLRKLLLDYFVWGIDLEWFSWPSTLEWLEESPQVAADLVKTFAAVKDQDDNVNPLQQEPSSYYYDDEDKDIVDDRSSSNQYESDA